MFSPDDLEVTFIHSPVPGCVCECFLTAKPSRKSRQCKLSYKLLPRAATARSVFQESLNKEIGIERMGKDFRAEKTAAPFPGWITLPLSKEIELK